MDQEERETHGRVNEIFVGRLREMDTLTAALDAATSGQGRLVMLAGEPGIGKTRTAQELALRAEQQGAQVLWGWCYENEGAPPYWPWAQPIRAYVQQADPEQIRSEMGPGAADIAEIIPEVRQKLPELEPAPALQPEQARFRLFDSISTFLKNAAQSQSLVLVLDDLQWADKPSLLLLEFLARQMAQSSLLIIGCYRDIELSRRHPLSETLSQLSRQPVFHREYLQGLTEEDTSRFIHNSVGNIPTPELVGNIHSRTEGNPFFTSEVVKLLEGEGELAGAADIRIPEGVREAIGQRLNGLSEGCNEVLTAASVIGREFDPRIISSLVELGTGDAILEGLEEALGAQVIKELPDVPQRYQFAHDLVRESLAIEVSAARRMGLHARIAVALEEMYGTDRETHASELAHHFSQAGPALGADKIVAYSILAGEQALTTYAHEQALGHFERGLAARGIPLTGAEPATDTETAALLFGLGRAQGSALPLYRIGEAVETLGRAFEYYANAGDSTRAVAIADIPFRFPSAAGFVSRALELVPSESLEAGRLWSRKGVELGRGGGGYTDAQECFQKALAIAQIHGDARLEARALAEASNVDYTFEHYREAADAGIRGAELGRRVNDLDIEAVGLGVAVMSLRIIGNLPGAREQARLMLDLADRLRNRTNLTNAIMFSTMLSLLEGDWVTSKALNERALAAGLLDPRQLSLRMQLEYQVGNLAEAGAYQNRLVEAIRVISARNLAFDSFTAIGLPMAARIVGSEVEPQVAEECAESIIASPVAQPLFTAWARAGQALAAVLRGDPVAAEQHYPQLESIRGTVVLVGPAGDRLLGLLSITMGNLDQAMEHFEDSLTFCRKAGYRPELAWTCRDYAEALLDGNSFENRATVTQLLDEASAICNDLGMTPLEAQVEALRDRIAAQPVPRTAYPDGLTQREVEVIRLIAVGKTDREIGEELFISVNTVGNHVRSILNKTNAANRTEAAAYATRRGLAGDAEEPPQANFGPD